MIYSQLPSHPEIAEIRDQQAERDAALFQQYPEADIFIRPPSDDEVVQGQVIGSVPCLVVVGNLGNDDRARAFLPSNAHIGATESTANELREWMEAEGLDLVVILKTGCSCKKGKGNKRSKSRKAGKRGGAK